MPARSPAPDTLKGIDGPHIQPRHIDTYRVGRPRYGLAQLNRSLPVRRCLRVAEHPLRSLSGGNPGGQFLAGAIRGLPVSGHLRSQHVAARRLQGPGGAFVQPHPLAVQQSANHRLG